MKIKIRLRNGDSVDIEAPDNTNFNVLCLHVKAAGYLMTDMLHIPYDFIASMIIEGPHKQHSIVVPGSETKQ